MGAGTVSHNHQRQGVAGDTNLLGPSGLLSMNTLDQAASEDKRLTPLKRRVWTTAGIDESSRFYRGGCHVVCKLRVKHGFEIRASRNHRFLRRNKNCIDWLPAGQLAVGDLLALQAGAGLIPRVREDEFLAGSSLAEEYHAGENSSLPHQLGRRSQAGFLMRLSELQGRSDGRGAAAGLGPVTFRSQTQAKAVQLMLLNLGVVSERLQSSPWNGQSVLVQPEQVQLLIGQGDGEDGGQPLQLNRRPQVLWLPVEAIDRDRTCIYDLVVPGSHTYWADGFVTHNGQALRQRSRVAGRGSVASAHF